MWLRGQRIPLTSVREFVYDEEKARVSHTDLYPGLMIEDYHSALAMGLLVADCEYRICRARDGSGECIVWFLDHSSRSWARVDCIPGDETFEVNQLGPRQLWDELAAAYTWWVQAGSPTAERWRFTVTPDGQQAGLHDTQLQTGAPHWLGATL